MKIEKRSECHITSTFTDSHAIQKDTIFFFFFNLKAAMLIPEFGLQFRYRHHYLFWATESKQSATFDRAVGQFKLNLKIGLCCEREYFCSELFMRKIFESHFKLRPMTKLTTKNIHTQTTIQFL